MLWGAVDGFVQTLLKPLAVRGRPSQSTDNPLSFCCELHMAHALMDTAATASTLVRPALWMTLLARRSAPRSALLLAATGMALVAGCSERTTSGAALQTAARVNQQEITVHQVNQLLQQQRGIKADQVEAASKRILQVLIDQEIAVQVSRELKLDQDPRVMLQIESARREVLTRAYAERLGETVGKPSAEAIKTTYDANPALYRERRIYSLQEISIEAQPGQVPALQDRLGAARSAAEFMDQLRAAQFRFSANQGVRAAEQLPAEVLKKIAALKDGQMLLLASPTGAVVIHLMASRPEPLDETQAQAAIEQLLMSDAKRQRLQDDLQQRRAKASIEYLGSFAPGAAPAAAPAVSGNSPAGSAAAISGDAISKGLGLSK